MGHKLDADRLHPTTAKIKAMVDAPSPKNLSELKSLLKAAKLLWPFLTKFVNHDTPTESITK